MAKNTKSSGQFTYDANYAAVTISGSTKDACLAWIEGVVEDWEALVETSLNEGYRITLKRDFNNNCLQCSYTQQDQKHHNANVILISRADVALEAILLNEYKIRVLFPEERLPTEREMGVWG